MHSAQESPPRKIIVAISGASGAVYGVRLLQVLRELGSVQTHLTVSDAGLLNLQQELDISLPQVAALADVTYPVHEVGATIASGSFQCDGMVVAPCSVRSMSEIATGVTTSLLTRAADVTLKERRRLVLAVRETPLHLGHLRTMTALTEMGAMILPPVPAFYAAPNSLEDLVDQFVGRILDCFGYNWANTKRWDGPVQKLKTPKA